jgi:Flp pilus assembly pilin Flp
MIGGHPGGEIMKTIVKRLIRDEKGAALALALILLLIGGLISAALLNHMGSGILAGEVHERRTAELYAADAGVEDAIWKIQHNDGYIPCNIDSPPRVYNITDVNGKNVALYIEYVGAGTYKITSVAITDGDGGGGIAAIDSATAVESYVSILYMDFSALLDNAIVSDDTIKIQPNNVVNGDVWLPIADEEHLINKGVINGTIKDEEVISIIWPTAEQLAPYYWKDVEHLETEAYPDGYVIDITGTSEEDPYVIGPLLAAGDLTINGNGWIKLDGTIYLKGTLFTNPTPEIHIALEGHTVFAEGDIKLNPGVWLYGSGCIIAVGDIVFQPNLDTEGENFVLVMSLEGELQFNPGTDFTGCVAGNVDVQLQPGNTINWISPEDKGLDFPMGADGGEEPPPVNVVNIESWEIIQQ